ncbi:MAG: glutamine-hydrolyzing GMP synthase [Candidatus Hodarchaeota archaeon]
MQSSKTVWMRLRLSGWSKLMIVVVDFGSQYSHLITKRFRELGEYTELIDPKALQKYLTYPETKGIVLSGGPRSVYEKSAPQLSSDVLKSLKPILGICYGYHLVAKLAGGTVIAGNKREYGVHEISLDTSAKIFAGLSSVESALMSHGDELEELPAGYSAIGWSEGEVTAFQNEKQHIYGLQFHPEVAHTPNGRRILENFLQICGASRTWQEDLWLEDQIKKIRKKVDGKILMAVSGGVDSTVAAAMIERAVPDKLHCVFIDNGLLRHNEAENVRTYYSSIFRHFHFIDASDEFLSSLDGISDPEKKRKIIGERFARILEAKAQQLENEFGHFKFLGQGTIYPDRIESAKASKKADLIKTHHNVGGLPDDLSLELIEPLTDLYKYEVRRVGQLLDIPHWILDRHPFPGPGLAVRLLGPIKKSALDVLREADAILLEELQNRDLMSEFWQVFFVLLPIKAVGVMGDARTYENVGVIRGVQSEDAMTASVPALDMRHFIEIANRIVNEVRGVNRVTLDLTSKPPATIEWE